MKREIILWDEAEYARKNLEPHSDASGEPSARRSWREGTKRIWKCQSWAGWVSAVIQRFHLRRYPMGDKIRAS